MKRKLLPLEVTFKGFEATNNKTVVLIHSDSIMGITVLPYTLVFLHFSCLKLF